MHRELSICGSHPQLVLLSSSMRVLRSSSCQVPPLSVGAARAAAFCASVGGPSSSRFLPIVGQRTDRRCRRTGHCCSAPLPQDGPPASPLLLRPAGAALPHGGSWAADDHGPSRGARRSDLATLAPLRRSDLATPCRRDLVTPSALGSWERDERSPSAAHMVSRSGRSRPVRGCKGWGSGRSGLRRKKEEV